MKKSFWSEVASGAFKLGPLAQEESVECCGHFNKHLHQELLEA